MRHLVCGFIGEGPTDLLFLEPLARRLLGDLLRDGDDQTDVHPSVIPTRPDRTVAAAVTLARRLRGTVDILFVHTDAKGRPERALTERVDPIAAGCGPGGPVVVGIVPVHETEAWALADGDALRHAFGTVLDDATLGVPATPGDLERLDDPKQRLREVQRRAMGGRRGRRTPPLPLGLLGQSVILGRLRRLPAFRRFEDDVRAALRTLHLLP